MLDQVNGRVQRWRSSGAATTVSVTVTGGIADMAVEADGTIDVLEPTGELRSFDAAGRLRSETPIADRTWSQLRIGPQGPEVQQEPSEVARARGAGAARASRTCARERERARRLPHG